MRTESCAMAYQKGFLTLEFLVAFAIFTLLVASCAAGYWLTLAQQMRACERLRALTVLNSMMERAQAEPAFFDQEQPLVVESMALTWQLETVPPVSAADAQVVPQAVQRHFRMVTYTLSWTDREQRQQKIGMTGGIIL